MADLDEWEREVHARFGSSGHRPGAVSAAAALQAASPLSSSEEQRTRGVLALLDDGAASAEGSKPPLRGDEDAVESMHRVLHLLKAEQAKKTRGWAEIWDGTWEHTKKVYVKVRRSVSACVESLVGDGGGLCMGSGMRCTGYFCCAAAPSPPLILAAAVCQCH